MAEGALGDRVRAMRIEKNLSQDGLAKLMPSRRHLSWVSGIERGIQEPSVADLTALADALQVRVGWLVRGDEEGETEFVARLRGMEPLMDERGRREVLSVAQRQVEEATATGDGLLERLVAAGFEAGAARRAIQAMQSTEPEIAPPAEAPPTRRARRARAAQ